MLTLSGSYYYLTYRDGSYLRFDSLGRLVNTSDAHGNQTSFSYISSTDQLLSINDPVGHAYQFTVSGSVITVLDTMPGLGGRRSVLAVNGSSQVTYDSIASPAARPAKSTYSYTSVGSNNANVLATRSDALGQTTTISYDARNRPTTATLPAVLPETGASTQSPTIGYRAAEQRGLDTILSADSVYVRITDPLGNWTRSALNRWGAATRTWDALGTVARAAYTPEGFLAWTEGKVADSTRTYFSYDTKGRLARTYRYRAANDIVQLDTLLYDATSNVIRRKNALGQRDSMAYNAKHDVTGAWTPSNEHSTYFYRTNGLLDSAKAPGVGTSSYVYTTPFNNVGSVVTAGTTVASNSFDAFGRLSETDRRVVTRRSGSTTYLQWRRKRTWYNELNQVDSTRVEHTAECASPCSTPTWPSGSDTAMWQQVRYLYDALGRDTARVSTTGRRTRYVYDALGRLRMRYPYADSAAIVDSFRYDLAGNARYQWTRRGYQISHYLDTRNRDTLTNVPGIGDFKHTYGGPNDDVTRAWINYASGADSVGVNPEVRWGYSQAGLVLADTAQGSRVTSHVYDRYLRDSAITDVNGTWTLRYDATRGILDTMRTPFGDTLRWAPDSLWRPIGPYVRNGATAVNVVQAFDSSRNVMEISTTQSVTLGDFNSNVDSDPYDPPTYMLPSWSEQQGSGGPTVTYQDTLARDGWGQVDSVTYMKNGAVEALERFSFDNEGNIASGVIRTYDGPTRRFLWVSGPHSYAYDRAGNMVQDSGVVVWKYSYDPLDRLVAARYNGTLIARYAYDALGRRIAKRVYNAGPYSATVAFMRMIYAGSHVVAESDSSGNLTLGYTWSLGTDNLIAVHKYGTGDWYAVQDAIHSVRGLTKRDGTWAASWRYRIYGAVLDSAGSAPFNLRYRWTGREFDAETGFYFFRSRMYDPNVQRFVQEDVSGFEGGPNVYAYGGGDPATGRDPDGISKEYEVTAAPPDRATPDCLGTLTCGDDPGDPWGGGGAMIGVGDYADFVGYSWARQLWHNVHGGSYSDFDKVWYGTKRGITDPAARAYVMYLFRMDRIQPLSVADFDVHLKVDSRGTITGVFIDPFAQAVTNTAPGRVGYIDGLSDFTIYVNVDWTRSFGETQYWTTLAHESEHLRHALNNTLGPLDDRGSCGWEEDRASAYASRVTGVWQRNRCN